MDIFRIIWPKIPSLPGVEIDLAKADDAEQISRLSKTLIETGLPGWIWPPDRIRAHIRSPQALVLVGRAADQIAAFAIMEFGRETANLSLLAVVKKHRRIGAGSCLVRFLENSAFLMGVSSINLEVRANNQTGRAFYTSLGYREKETIKRYYSNGETAIRMSRRLHIKPSIEHAINLSERNQK